MSEKYVYSFDKVDLELNKKEHVFSVTLLVFIVLVIVAFLIIVVIILAFFGSQIVWTQKRKAVEDFFIKFDANSTPGSSNDGNYLFSNCTVYRDQPTCEADPLYRKWENGRCQCVNPFWGLTGNRETYNYKYNAIGIPDERKLFRKTNGGETSIVGISESVTNRLSFPLQSIEKETMTQTMCTDLCDKDPNCTGVLVNKIIDNGEIMIDRNQLNEKADSYTCLLLATNINSSDYINFYPLQDSTLYMKKPEYYTTSNLGRPSFPNNVFIYQNVQNLPYRFWTPQDRNDITILRKNINNALPFIPTGCVNDGNLTGVFSNEAVSVNTARELIDNNPGNNILVDGKYFISNSSSFVLPSVLTGKQITVIYV